MMGISSFFVLLLAGMLLALSLQQHPLGTKWNEYTTFSSSFAISSSSSLSSTTASTFTYETFDGTDLGISFQFPSKWVKYEAGFDPGTLNEGVVSFDIIDDDPSNQVNDLQPGINGLKHPNLSILSLKLPYNNLTLEQYAKVRTFDLGHLFSDYNLNITENKLSNETLDGYPYWIIEYFFNVDDKTKRYGMLLLLIRGEKVYEISYIADGYMNFIKNLQEIKNMIKTAYFMDPVNRH
jgi:hypothetical protein